MSAHVGRYCELGWRIVRLNGVAKPSVCTCHKGARCPTPGKHPVGTEWQKHATSDEDVVESWFEDNENINIGVLLGPSSGIIDIELDDDAAKETWASLGLGEIWTPTYTAGRGPHRIFKWQDGLPPVAVKKAMGIEFRLGNDGKASQSVLPPSTHHSGAKYAWVDGLSPSDVETAEVPDKLLRILWNDDGAGPVAEHKPPASLIVHEKIEKGGRNNALYRFACDEGFRCRDINSEKEQQDMLAKISAINAMQCVPPLSPEEVVSIYRSAVAFVRKTQSVGMPIDVAMSQCERGIAEKKKRGDPTPKEKDWVRAFTVTGLHYAPPRDGADPEWWPGEWQLTVVHSDPLEYRLHVPAWAEWTANGSGNISLSVATYRSSTKVAAAVLAATGVVMLDDEPGKWKRIWDGGGKKKPTRGIKAKLLDNVTHEWPGASSLRYVVLAGWLYDRLSQASQPNDDDTPCPTGRAAWRADGTLWWNWTKVWEDIERNHRVMEGERQALKRRLIGKFGDGATDFRHAEFRHLGGARKTYVVWTKREFAVLEQMATEEAGGLGGQ
jgi:hypothetical protein